MHLVGETFHSATFCAPGGGLFLLPRPARQGESRLELSWMAWVGFNVFVLALLALDLGVFHRNDHQVSAKEAAVWTVVWIVLAVAFGGVLYFWEGADAATRYFTGYLIEKSLSADNIFVFLMIFSFFKVPPQYQHRVLFWGILGALVMRATMIGVGTALLNRFHWLIYVFGAFLAWTGLRMAAQQESDVDLGENRVVKWFRRVMPVTDHYHGHNFFVRQGRKLLATPLFLVLLVIESSDVMFALDSVPAIFAVTTDPFLVYTSNVFAILGLRSMYFLLADVMGKLRFLKVGLSLILTFVGAKMLLSSVIAVPPMVSLTVIGTILGVTVGASLLLPEPKAGPSRTD